MEKERKIKEMEVEQQETERRYSCIKKYKNFLKECY